MFSLLSSLSLSRNEMVAPVEMPFWGLFFAPISASAMPRTARSVLLSLVWLGKSASYQELLCGFDKWLLSDRGKKVERKNFEVIILCFTFFP